VDKFRGFRFSGAAQIWELIVTVCELALKLWSLDSLLGRK